MYKLINSVLLIAFILLAFNTNAQITVTSNQTAQELVDRLTGPGVIVLNPTLVCPTTASAKFTFSPNISDIGIDSGIVLSTGSTINSGGNIGIPNPPSSFASTSFNAAGDADLTTLINSNVPPPNSFPTATHDACVLSFDFVPAGDSIKFDYVLASEEYPVFNCSINDIFGFFVSGPNYPISTNIALVPGTTNTMVGISTVNNGTGGSAGSSCDYNTFGNGPYTQYYNTNTGTSIVYNGYTDVFTAKAAVNACDTYHLKLAIADASDWIYDSGVFLKAGSLTSTAISVETFGGAGLETPFTNTVRGCPPGKVVIKRSGGLNQPVTIPLMYGGTAVNGFDYTLLPNSVTIPAGDTVATLYISGIPMAPQGVKTVVVSALSPYTCSTGLPVILGSDTINIYDSIYVKILNPDTTICLGQSVDLQTEGDSILIYTWTPSATVDNPSAQNVTVTPTATTTYTVSVNLAVIAACPASTDKVKITVKEKPIIDLGPDVATCGTAVQLNAATQPTNPDETFTWTPPNNLSNPNIRNPLASPNTTTVYTVTVNPGAIGCDAIDSIRVRILPDHIDVLNMDTVVCDGAVISLRVNGDTAFAYNWNPELDIQDPFSSNTTLTAHHSGYYTLTASFPGCIAMPDSFYVEVQPVPKVNIGLDKTICAYDTVHFFAAVDPDNYNNYSYLWSPGILFSDSTINNPIFKSDANPGLNVKVIVTTPIGCMGTDSMMIHINPGDFLQVNPIDTAVCPPAFVQLNARGAQSYSWSPAWGLNNTNIANPLAQPETTTEYILIGKSALNCYDTQKVFIQVFPNAVVNLPDSVTIWPGENYTMNPDGNALYYSWFPPSGLSAVDISNPVANPEVRTRYFVTGTTEDGCSVKDSIDVLVNTSTVLEVPNAFTPGNGVNGTFKILRRGQATLSYFRIFNRWGNVVFETTNIDQAWDGTYKGKAQPMGVYPYIIEGILPNGKVIHKEGNVTLVR